MVWGKSAKWDVGWGGGEAARGSAGELADTRAMATIKRGSAFISFVRVFEWDVLGKGEMGGGVRRMWSGGGGIVGRR